MVIVLGYMFLGTTNQASNLTGVNVGYANLTQAKNAAQMGVQLAVNKINAETGFEDTHYSEGTAYIDTMISAETRIWVEKVSETTNDSGLKEERLRINAVANYNGQQASMLSLYEKSELHYVPEFKSVISFNTSDFTFLMADSASVNGADPSASCQDMPGFITPTESDSSKIAQNSNGNVQGNPSIKVDTSASYTSFKELVTYLNGMSDAKHLSGTYTGTLGDSTSPDVFFVDSPVEISKDLTNGYGIIVFKDDGQLYYEDNTKVANNLTFSGLAVFEDAWDLKAEFAPSILGSIVVVHSESAPTLDVVLDGGMKIQFDCNAKKFARQASALVIDQNGFRRIVSFE